MFANVTWPSLLLYERERAWWIIIAVVAVEFVILFRTLGTTWGRALALVAAMNTFSALIGSIAMVGGELGPAPPLVWIGLYWALVFDGTFSSASWGVAAVSAAVLNTFFEGLFLVLVQRVTSIRISWRCLIWLAFANLISAILTRQSLGIVSPW